MRAGILAPVFSLPGSYGIGDFGKNTYRFVDMIAHKGVRIWQVLPLNPLGFGNSPYQADSSFAGEPLFIDPETLYKEGLLETCPPAFEGKKGRVDYEAVRAFKDPIFREAFAAFKPDADYEAFLKKEPWVEEYALFKALLRKNGGKSWYEWPKEDKALAGKSQETALFKEERAYETFLQYEFRKQWGALKAYANERGIRILGDLPFYAGGNSLDTFLNRDEFLLDKNGKPELVAGVPPDYFSATGQRWGNPIYNWDVMEENGFRYWNERLMGLSELYDMVRIDHFRAFDSYWVIPESEPTAVVGEWRYAPGYAFFDQLLPKIPHMEIVAEDLGYMRDEVYVLRDHYDLPGMKVLEFVWNDPSNEPRPNMICYTGTHDNDTALGWYRSLSRNGRKGVKKALGFSNARGGFARAFVRAALADPAETVVIPVQDIIGLGNEARINLPGSVSEKNWTWRMADFNKFSAELDKFSTMLKKSGRYFAAGKEEEKE